MLKNITATKRNLIIAISLLVMVLVLGSCRNETQNNLRRQIQDFTGQRMYITLYSLDGKEIYNGQVNGKVTRSASGGGTAGYYIFWYDEKGVYHQTDLAYLLTSKARDSVTSQTTAGSTDQ